MNRADRAGLFALGGAAFALRLATLIRYDEDIDALRFALAVDRFDVAALRPHAPFYPVYVASAKVVAALGASRDVALGIAGAAFGAALVVATALLAREVVGRRGTHVAGALALASPMLWLLSNKLTSDIAGAAFVTTALWLAARARRLEAEAASPPAVHRLRTAALITLGVGLGARLSIFPFALACVFVIARAEGGSRALVARVRDLSVGVVSWLVPLVIATSPALLVRVTIAQAEGHFTRWGGTAITVSSPIDRLYGLAWGAWASGLGGAWPDASALRWLGLPLLIALLFAGFRDVKRLARAHPELAIGSLAYLAWVLVGQNIASKPRHLLPLVPIAIVVLARGSERLTLRSKGFAVVALALTSQWFFDAAELARAHQEPSPAAAIVLHLGASSGPIPSVITADLARMIEEGAPLARVVEARSSDEVLATLDADPARAWLVTSEALTKETRAAIEARGRTVSVAFSTPRSRYIDALWSDLALVSISPKRPKGPAARTPR